MIYMTKLTQERVICDHDKDLEEAVVDIRGARVCCGQVTKVPLAGVVSVQPLPCDSSLRPALYLIEDVSSILPS